MFSDSRRFDSVASDFGERARSKVSRCSAGLFRESSPGPFTPPTTNHTPQPHSVANHDTVSRIMVAGFPRRGHFGVMRCQSLGAFDSLSKREVAGPIPAAGSGFSHTLGRPVLSGAVWPSMPLMKLKPGSCGVNRLGHRLGDPRLLSLVAEHSLSKREVAGPIPAEGLVWNIAGGSIMEHSEILGCRLFGPVV